MTILAVACGEADTGTDGGGSSGGGSTASTDPGGHSTGAENPTTTNASADPSGTMGETMGATTGEPGTTTGGSSTSGGTSTSGVSGDTSGGDTTGGDTGGSVNCLLEGFVDPDAAIQLDYAQFNPVIGTHCKGTNHQDIIDIERVVFLGDSVTVGTPPTLANDYYRAQLADALADRFGLVPPNGLWDQSNPIDGVALIKDSGDFSSCAKWGARTDDFLPPGPQIDDCFPPDLMDKRTLVITTMGGNDIAAIAKDGANGKPYDQVMADAEAAVQKMRDAVHWFVDDPNKFPNGVFVLFANVYEFTDGTADLMSCPAAGLGGFDEVEDFPAAFEVGAAGRGQYQAAGAAGDQLDAKVRFKRRHLASDHRAGHVQLPRHRGKTAEFGDTQIDAHAVETIHRFSSRCRIRNK